MPSSRMSTSNTQKQSHILMATSEGAEHSLAGSGIRTTQLAQVLSLKYKVTVVSPWADQIAGNLGNSNLHWVGLGAPGTELLDSSLVILQAFSSRNLLSGLTNTKDKYIVVDFYCPFWLENSISIADLNSSFKYQIRIDIDEVRDQLRIGDFFICATMRQRDMLIGMLSVIGRITPAQLHHDPALTSLIGIVPFGLTSNDFSATGQTVQSLMPAATREDRTFVWGGGIHDWLDVETPIRAMIALRDRRPKVRLLFATNRSHPEHDSRRAALRAQLMAEDAGLLGKSVHFLDGWVPYDQRDRYLRGATAGIVCHQDHVETRFAFRTRVLDYLWAGLPIVTSDGDEFADLVRKFDLGIVVPPGDPQALANAFVNLVERIDAGEPFKDRIASIRPLYHWNEVAKPLLEFCANPRKTAHLGDQVLMAGLPDVMTPRREVSRLLYRTMTVLRNEGPKTVVRKVARKMLTLLRRARSG